VFKEYPMRTASTGPPKPPAPITEKYVVRQVARQASRLCGSERGGECLALLWMLTESESAADCRWLLVSLVRGLEAGDERVFEFVRSALDEGDAFLVEFAVRLALARAKRRREVANYWAPQCYYDERPARPASGSRTRLPMRRATPRPREHRPSCNTRRRTSSSATTGASRGDSSPSGEPPELACAVAAQAFSETGLIYAVRRRHRHCVTRSVIVMEARRPRCSAERKPPRFVQENVGDVAAEHELPELVQLIRRWQRGEIEPLPVGLGRLPDDATPPMKAIAAHMKDLFGLLAAAGEDRALIYAYSWAVNAGCAPTRQSAGRALQRLLDAEVIEPAGELPPYRGKAFGTRLYRPPSTEDGA
jgi:hypothetical protein